MLCSRKMRLYLGVWARVKRRLWRLMLRFIIIFRKSSGEFRGDPRGESFGEILGEPPGEPALGLGMSLMSLVNLWSCGISSTSDSSELSVHSSLMAIRSVSAFTWASLKLAPKVNQAVFPRRFGVMVLFSSVPAGATASGLLLASICLNKSWAHPWSLQTSSHQHIETRAPPAQTFISIGNLFLLYT